MNRKDELGIILLHPNDAPHDIPILGLFNHCSLLMPTIYREIAENEFYWEVLIQAEFYNPYPSPHWGCSEYASLHQLVGWCHIPKPIVTDELKCRILKSNIKSRLEVSHYKKFHNIH